MPDASILALGSDDADADALAASTAEVAERPRASGDWGWVHGERLIVRDPARCLPLLDDYEDSRPDAPSPYERVLVGVESKGRGAPAWVYTKAATAEDLRIPKVIWNPAS